MKDDCEIREEFIYSKQQLGIFVNSVYVTSRLGSVFSGSVNIYLKNVVEPLESYFWYYLKANIRHYGIYSNCGHEGTNNALKYCAANVMPRHNIENSLRILVDGSDLMMAKKKNLLLTYLKLPKQGPD